MRAHMFESRWENALRDISKKYPELIAVELGTWNLETKEVSQVYRLASKVIERG